MIQVVYFREIGCLCRALLFYVDHYCKIIRVRKNEILEIFLRNTKRSVFTFKTILLILYNFNLYLWNPKEMEVF